mmetsp:Transcript_57515/g.65615  ORF Transcript_57515/g.65615 Transcript_57515/m.65615 type:complete len:138 (+) Transcript_57515:359-772(+)
MYLIEWIKDISIYLGFNQRECNLLFLGLDNSGKTTCQELMQPFDPRSFQATHYYRGPLTFRVGRIKFNYFDLGGHKPVRRLWKDYLEGTESVIFVVDASDLDRLEEAKEELEKVREFYSSRKDVPILVLGEILSLKS